MYPLHCAVLFNISKYYTHLTHSLAQKMNAKVKGTVWCHLTTRCHSFALHVHKNIHFLMMEMPALHHTEHCIISYSWNIMRWMLYIAVFRSCILCFYCMTWWEESWCSNVMQWGFWTWSGNCPLQSRHKPTQSANQARCTLHRWRDARHSNTQVPEHVSVIECA